MKIKIERAQTRSQLQEQARKDDRRQLITAIIVIVASSICLGAAVYYIVRAVNVAESLGGL